MSYLEDINVQTPFGEFHMIVGKQEGGEDIVRASGWRKVHE